MRIRKLINGIIANANDYGLLLISLLIIFGASVYYLYALNWLGTAITLLLTIIVFYFLSYYFLKPVPTEKNYLILNKKYLIWGAIYLVLAGLTFWIAYCHQSAKALISPWQLLDWRFFSSYLATTFILIMALREKTIAPTGKLILISLHYFLSFSVAAIIYQIGYGFDPFIHQATMELIDKKGLVTPKPAYYLGEYGLVIIFHKISGLAIYGLNKFLVPFLASLFLPVTVYRFLGHEMIGKETAIAANPAAANFLAVLFLLGLTFSPFTVTTPQNLSYLFLILAIFAGLGRNNPLWTLILSLATAAIHPLTGIPALLFAAYIFLRKYRGLMKPWLAKAIGLLIFLASALGLPLALLLTNNHNSQKFSGGLSLLAAPFQSLFANLSVAGQEDWLLNAIYFLADNHSLFLILAILASLFYFYRLKPRPDWRPLIYLISSLLVAYTLASQINFHDLIDYEQTNYAGRILVLILIFCLPFISAALAALIRRLLASEKTIATAWLVFGLAFLGTSLYLSYPRFDKYFNSRGYSVGENDISAVRLIAANAAKPYIVLANQQVSVAALKELGFDHYYKTPASEIYFYPIPTGGPLYRYYLDMVYKNPDRKTMAEAMDLAGVNESYLVVNKYWHESGKVINAAKLTADSWQAVNDDVYIFSYRR